MRSFTSMITTRRSPRRDEGAIHLSNYCCKTSLLNVVVSILACYNHRWSYCCIHPLPTLLLSCWLIDRLTKSHWTPRGASQASKAQPEGPYHIKPSARFQAFNYLAGKPHSRPTTFLFSCKLFDFQSCPSLKSPLKSPPKPPPKPPLKVTLKVR